MARFGHGRHAAGAAALDQHPRDLRSYDQPRAGLVRVREPGLDDRLLGADAAAQPAVAALLALRAAPDVPGHGVYVPAELDAALLKLAISRRGFVVLLVDPEALADRVERGGVELGVERRDPKRCPLGPDLVRGAERRGVVDHGPAAEA